MGYHWRAIQATCAVYICYSVTAVNATVHLTCTTGSFVTNEGSSYDTTVAGCREPVFSSMNCKQIPAGPVKFIGGVKGRDLTLSWEARDDVGGSYAYLKGFKMLMFVEELDTSPYLLFCLFIRLREMNISQENMIVRGKFHQECCTDEETQPFSVTAILYSFPRPNDCPGHSISARQPRSSRVTIVLPEPNLRTQYAQRPTTHNRSASAIVLDTGEDAPPTAVTVGVAVGGAILTLVTLCWIVICWKRRTERGGFQESAPSSNLQHTVINQTEHEAVQTTTERTRTAPSIPESLRMEIFSYNMESLPV